jgi:hypothetical protein
MEEPVNRMDEPPVPPYTRGHQIRQLADDNIGHGKLMLAVKKHVLEKRCLMYIGRWLQMPVPSKLGELIQKQGKGAERK